MKILCKKNYLEIVCIFLLSVAVSICNVKQPLISALLLDHGIACNITGIKENILNLLLVTISLLIFEWLRKLMTSRYKKDLTDLLKEKVLEGIYVEEYCEFKKKSNQNYISIFNNEIPEIINYYYILIVDLLFSFFSILVYSISLFSIDTLLAIVTIINNVIPITIPRLFRKKLQNGKTEYLDTLQIYNTKLGDSILGYDVIKTSNKGGVIQRIVKKYCGIATEKCRKYENTNSCCEMIVAFFSYINYLSIIIFGVYMIYKGRLTAGDLLATVSVSELLVGPVTNISFELNSINAISKVKQKVLKEYINVKTTNNTSGCSIDEVKSIQLKNVSFNYENKMLLNSLNLVFEKGKKYLIYGQNGCGKSTLFKVLTKIYSNYSGEITINGIDLSKIDNSDYYNQVGIVLQDSFMFNDTLLNNLSFFAPKNQEEEIHKMIETLSLERLRNEIFSDNVYIDSENNLSGGEKQKINIARILLQNKKVLLLDEATSAFDINSYKDFMSYIINMQGTMLINIEHKIPKESVYFYDEIIHIDSGKVVGQYRTKQEKEDFINAI